MLGPAVLYAALTRVLRRLTEAGAGAGTGALVAVIDDAHLAGPALADLLRFAARQDLSLAVVAAVRTGEGVPLPGTARIQLTALTRAAVEELVGPGRAARLYDRSRGHPLFLTELAQQTAAAELPASLVESVAARCDELGPAGSLLRTAAVIGPELDVDLLAALSGRGVVDVLDYAAQAAAQAVPGRGRRRVQVPARAGQGGAGGQRERRAVRAAAPAGGPGAGHPARGGPGHGGRARPAGRGRGAGQRGAVRRRGPGRRAVRSRRRGGAARRRGAAGPAAASLARPGPGADPAGRLRRRPARRRPRGPGRPGRAGGRRLGLVLRPPVHPGGPVRGRRRAGRRRRADPGPVPGGGRPDRARGR